MTNSVSQVSATGRALSDAQPEKLAPNPSLKEVRENTRPAKIATGVGIASILGLGIALKDGVTEGFQSIAHVGRKISSFFGLAVVFLFPVATMYGQYEEYKGKDGGDDGSKILEITNPLLSLAFAPMTAFEPLEKATKSTGHMIAGLINMPHILFTFFSYTGGRFLTLWKSIQLGFFNPSEEKKFRLEKERSLLKCLGDIGSDNAAITPQAHQFATGLNTWGNLLTGNLDAVKETFSDGPVTALLGTFVSTFTWIPSLVGKTFDTTIRTLEMTDQLKNVFSENSRIYKAAKSTRDWWHTTSLSNNFIGKVLSSGRAIGKFTQATMSPMGMVSVVFPAWDHFFKNGFNNPGVRERGGIIAAFDRILNIGAFIGHSYCTTLYGLFIRLPQTIVTSSFYACNTINKIRGLEGKHNDSRYLDPSKIRDFIFNPNKGWAKSLSDFAQKHMKNLTGRRTLFDNFHKVLAERKCYRPIREGIYKEAIQTRYEYIDEKGEIKTKEENKEPPRILWNKILEERKEEILIKSKERFKDYLKASAQFNEQDIDEFFNKACIYKEIEKELIGIIDKEIGANNNGQNKEENGNSIQEGFKKPELKSNSFFDMLRHPIKYFQDLKEISKFRSSIAQFILSPLNVLDFVNMVDLGNKNHSFKINKFMVEESSIEKGDFVAGVVGEVATVLAHDAQTACYWLAA